MALLHLGAAFADELGITRLAPFLAPTLTRHPQLNYIIMDG